MGGFSDAHKNLLTTKNFINLRAHINPSMYDTAYQRSARFMPNNSIENISGLIFGKIIILFLKLQFNLVVKTKTPQNARVTIQSLLSKMVMPI